MNFNFNSSCLNYRLIASSDKKLYVGLYTNPQVMQFIAEPLADDYAEKLFESQLKPWNIYSKHFLNLIISEKDSGQDIGLCGLITRNQLSKQAEVGMVFMPDYHGKGYGTETLTRLSQFAFKELGYNKLWGPPFPENKASIRIMEKSGYTREATLRQNQFLNGKYHDTPFYTLLKEEYESIL